MLLLQLVRWLLWGFTLTVTNTWSALKLHSTDMVLRYHRHRNRGGGPGARAPSPPPPPPPPSLLSVPCPLYMSCTTNTYCAPPPPPIKKSFPHLWIYIYRYYKTLSALCGFRIHRHSSSLRGLNGKTLT